LINLNPLSLIGSLFGGGGFRDVDLKIADLEVRVSDLVRRRAEVTVQMHDQVLGLVLEVEKGYRQLELLRSQVESQRRRVAIVEVGYRLGQGETAEMMQMWQQIETLAGRVVEIEVQREQSVRKLSQLTDCSASLP
jgi:outer membrane protein TolC